MLLSPSMEVWWLNLKSSAFPYNKSVCHGVEDGIIISMILLPINLTHFSLVITGPLSRIRATHQTLSLYLLPKFLQHSPPSSFKNLQFLWNICNKPISLKYHCSHLRLLKYLFTQLTIKIVSPSSIMSHGKFSIYRNNPSFILNPPKILICDMSLSPLS